MPRSRVLSLKLISLQLPLAGERTRRPENISGIMKRAKKIAIVLLTGFLAFAPPGTLIFGLIFIVGLIGNRRVVIVAGLGLLASAIIWFVIRRRLSQKPKLPD